MIEEEVQEIRELRKEVKKLRKAIQDVPLPAPYPVPQPYPVYPRYPRPWYEPHYPFWSIQTTGGNSVDYGTYT